MTILLAIAHQPTFQEVSRCLTEAGYQALPAPCGKSVDEMAQSIRFDLIVLEAALYPANLKEVIHGWRAVGVQAPILALVGKESEAEVGLLLEAGVQSCLSQPVREEALLKEVGRFSQAPRPRKGAMRVHDLEIDLDAKCVRRGGEAIDLTPREFALLVFLASRRGEVVTRPMLRQSIWRGRLRSWSNVIDVYIRHLRDKIDRGHGMQLILTRWGYGYMMRGEAGASRQAVTGPA
jgi:DNA-binding response OmpR family regulator